MVSDRNQIVGILALHHGLITPEQSAMAIEACVSDSSVSFLDVYQARGWIDQDTRAKLERLLEEKMAALSHDPAATFVEAASLENLGSTEAMEGEIPSKGLENWADVETRTDDPAATAFDSDNSVAELDAKPGARDPLTFTLTRVSMLGGSAEGVSRYSRTHLHARGGIGQVWLAKDGDLGREVALKELRPEQSSNTTAWSRFLEEARITGQLEHPGIVPVYELVTNPETGKPFYTMRFIRGGTLFDAIQAYHKKRADGLAGSLDLAGLLTAFIGVCNAIGYAHSRGVIHRDLKGQNVVLGDFGEVMVLDWGLAKRVDSTDPEQTGPTSGLSLDAFESYHQETMHGQVLGTPSYMAPEQAEGRLEAIDRRTDIYGLGAILYELLAGRPPYSGAATAEVLRRVREEPPAPPGQVAPGTPKALEAICLKAMEKKPENRYQSAMTLAEDVRRWVADEPVSAYRDPWLIRTSRWAKRHRSAVASAAAFLVASTAILSVATVLVGLERNEARSQRAQARLAVDDMYTKVADQWLEDRLDPVQREFLQKASRYYEEFTHQDGNDTAIRRERGRAFLRLGDVLRKLGQHDQAEAAYRRAVEVLGSMARIDQPGDLDHAVAIARLGSELATRTKKADLAEAEALDLKAIAILDPLVNEHLSVDLGVESSRVERALAEILRTRGKLDDSEARYARAIARGRLADQNHPGSVEVGQELAASFDGLGVLLRERDRREEAEALDRQAIALLEPLVAKAPNLPRLRDGLAKAYNSLGLLNLEAGAIGDAEAILRRQVALNERLLEDFPDRPEYRRTLARGLKNLGMLLRQTARPRDAEQAYRKALELNEKLATDSPEVRNFVRDQAICLNNLGELVMTTTRRLEADALFARAQKLFEQLANEDAEVPEHRLSISRVLNNRGVWLRGSGRVKDAIARFRQAADRAEPLVVADPSNPSYRREQAKALTNLGNACLADGNHLEAEKAYQKAVGRFDELVARPPVLPSDRVDLANCLSGRGANQLEGKLPGAEDSLRRSLALFDDLSTRPPLSNDLRRKVAASRINLGDFLRVEKRWPEAEVAYEEAVGMLDALVLENPTVVEYQGDLGDVLGGFGKLRVDQERLADARGLFDRASKADRVVSNANKNNPSFRKALGNHLGLLANVLVRLGSHAEAARACDEMIQASADVPGTRADYARLMVRCISLVENDTKLSPSRRSALMGTYADRAINQLREALETKEAGADQLIAEELFAPIRSRDGFKTLQLASTSQDDPSSD